MLVNEFSWSKSRDDIFRQCALRYYYHYYGSWNGWNARAEARTRELYTLKKLQTRQMWMGTCVHEIIEQTLKNIRGRGLVAHFPAAKQILLNRMRQDFAQSRVHAYRERKACALFEHEYGLDVPDEEWKRIADSAVVCLENFFGSEPFKIAEQLKDDQWLEIEEFSHFYLEGTKVHVVLDFSYRTPEGIRLVDWKTGSSETNSNQLQLACYRLYATEKWQVSPEQVEAIEYRLLKNEMVHHHLTGLDLKAALEKITDSIRAMRERLDNPEANQATEDHFPPTEERSRCFQCNFKKSCRAWM